MRMERYCQNAMTVAKFLEGCPQVESVHYPGLPGNPYYELGKKYLPKGTSGVISFNIKGGRDTAMKFMDGLKLASNEVHVADIRTCVLHPASETHPPAHRRTVGGRRHQSRHDPVLLRIGKYRRYFGRHSTELCSTVIHSLQQNVPQSRRQSIRLGCGLFDFPKATTT